MMVTGLGQCSLDYLALVDSYPEADTKTEVLEWHEQGGGPAATALVALARLGIPCSFHGVVGDDDAGGKIRRSLADEGIDTSGLKVVKKGVSQIAFIAIEKATAKRTIFWRRPSGGTLQADDLGEDFLNASSFLLLDGLMADVSLYAAAKARALNIPLMLDAGRDRPGMVRLARLCDYVVASEEFAKDLGWPLAEDVLSREREKFGVAALTVTLGERGSMTASGEGAFYVPAFRVDAVDTTGAGDVFHGGYVYGLLRRWNLRDTVTFASALAAMKCMRMGGREGIPRLPEVIRFLAERGQPIGAGQDL